MRHSYFGYYKLNDEELNTLWKNALFIFDTNVLLNLYRYQESTRDALLEVMETLKGKMWIPFHVGLEYHRNRLKVIAEQKTRFSEVKNIIADSISKIEDEFNKMQLKTRHSQINPENIIKQYRAIQKEYEEELSKLEDSCITVSSEDIIRDRLDELYDGKIGKPPKTQEEVNELFEEGDARYSNCIPPGFKDDSKDKTKSDEFSYAGIVYRRKYGDLIIWKQIISYAREKKVSKIIFVTDDKKADWWWKERCDGEKTIGVRPELREEILRDANVGGFHVYNTEGFLKYANKKLDAQITDDAIDEVRAVSIEKLRYIRAAQKHQLARKYTETAVFKWLSDRFDRMIPSKLGFPDFIGYSNEDKYGFEVKYVTNPRVISNHLRELFYRAYYTLNEEGFFEMVIIFVISDDLLLPKLEEMLRRHLPDLRGRIRIMIGRVLSDSQNDISEFLPLANYLV